MLWCGVAALEKSWPVLLNCEFISELMEGGQRRWDQCPFQSCNTLARFNPKRWSEDDKLHCQFWPIKQWKGNKRILLSSRFGFDFEVFLKFLKTKFCKWLLVSFPPAIMFCLECFPSFRRKFPWNLYKIFRISGNNYCVKRTIVLAVNENWYNCFAWTLNDVYFELTLYPCIDLPWEIN